MEHSIYQAHRPPSLFFFPLPFSFSFLFLLLPFPSLAPLTYRTHRWNAAARRHLQPQSPTKCRRNRHTRSKSFFSYLAEKKYTDRAFIIASILAIQSLPGTTPSENHWSRTPPPYLPFRKPIVTLSKNYEGLERKTLTLSKKIWTPFGLPTLSKKIGPPSGLPSPKTSHLPPGLPSPKNKPPPPQKTNLGPPLNYPLQKRDPALQQLLQTHFKLPCPKNLQKTLTQPTCQENPKGEFPRSPRGRPCEMRGNRGEERFTLSRS